MAIYAALAAIGSAAGAAIADAQPASPRPQGACAMHAPEAASRSGLSADMVLRVMHAESRGDPRAVSHKGAMGCMQIMPATWAYLTGRYRLGPNPYDPRMNMIGGALYLAELVARFGLPGAYSAYNAGPGRYQRYHAKGVPLPAETVAYTAQLGGSRPAPTAAPAQPRWQEASLFMTRPSALPGAQTQTAAPDERASAHDRAAPERGSTGLFPMAQEMMKASAATADGATGTQEP